MTLSTVQQRSPLITVVALTATEGSHTFRAYTRAFQMRVNDNPGQDIRFSWDSGGTANGQDYQVLRDGEIWWESDVYFGGEEDIIYLRSPDGNVDISIMEWK